MRRFVTGLAAGGLATSLLLAASYLGSWAAGVPSVPYSVFEALTNVLPGQVMAAWSMVIVGAIVVAVLFAAVLPRSRRVACRWSVGAGLLVAILVLPAAVRYGGGRAPLWLEIAWFLLIFLGWGYIVGRMWAWTESLPAAGGAEVSAAVQSGPGPPAEVLSRRRFLVRVGGAAATVTVLGAGVASVLASQQSSSRPAPPPTVPLPRAHRVMYSPYARAPSMTFKGAIHFHTTASDGINTPSEMFGRFATKGYEWLVPTDHDAICPDPHVEGILYIPGVEESCVVNGHPCHIVGVNVAGQLETTDVQTVIDAQPFNSLAHPKFGKTTISLAEALSWSGFQAVEVYSQTTGPTEAADLWDGLLSAGRRVYGLAVDDAHAAYTAGTTAVHVFARELTQATVMEALSAGCYYFGYGPTLAIAENGLSLAVTSSDTSNFTFLGRGGATLATVSGATDAKYVYVGREGYVRCVVERVSDNKRAWTNPVWLA